MSTLFDRPLTPTTDDEVFIASAMDTRRAPINRHSKHATMYSEMKAARLGVRQFNAWDEDLYDDATGPHRKTRKQNPTEWTDHVFDAVVLRESGPAWREWADAPVDPAIFNPSWRPERLTRAMYRQEDRTTCVQCDGPLPPYSGRGRRRIVCSEPCRLRRAGKSTAAHARRQREAQAQQKNRLDEVVFHYLTC